MGTNVNLLERMAMAGISLADAHWYHCVARPRGFTGPRDGERARCILRTIAQRSPH
ncbi:MAG: hypothetical protein L6Q68_17275 [Aquabacterium sp.]|jgi:hypothetical protein|nr:hypothetical protein [Aquabacterium sp.]